MGWWVGCVSVMTLCFCAHPGGQVYICVNARFSGQKCKITSSMSKTLRTSAVAQGAYLGSLLDSFAVDILTVGFHQTIPRQNPAVAC